MCCMILILVDAVLGSGTDDELSRLYANPLVREFIRTRLDRERDLFETSDSDSDSR